MDSAVGQKSEPDAAAPRCKKPSLKRKAVQAADPDAEAEGKTNGYAETSAPEAPKTQGAATTPATELKSARANGPDYGHAAGEPLPETVVEAPRTAHSTNNVSVDFTVVKSDSAIGKYFDAPNGKLRKQVLGALYSGTAKTHRLDGVPGAGPGVAEAAFWHRATIGTP